MTDSFVHLHTHTHYSMLDGSIKIDDLIARVKELGMPAVAMTDHGNMCGMVEFYNKAKKAGIQPIIGCEVYVTNMADPPKEKKGDDIFHLVLLVKDTEGYHNLVDMVTYSYIHGFYKKNLIPKSYLAERTAGLIGLSACLQGEIPYLLRRDAQRAHQAAHFYKDIFAPGDFYLEIQANEMEEQLEVNDQLVLMATELDLPLVATNDVHFLTAKDWEYHEAVVCIGTGKTMSDDKRMRFPKGLYLKSPKEMHLAFQQNPDALANTLEIAGKCDFSFTFGDYHFPNFHVPDGYDTDSYLNHLVQEGFRRKIQPVLDGMEDARQRDASATAYQERLEQELGVIKSMGFSGYMLIVWDIVNHCRTHGIGVGPGRGSAAGSVVVYCLDIAEVDPMRYDLLFERFLNTERYSMPDIDIDICQEKRQKVIDYLADKYGKENVAQIVAFSQLSPKAAIKDVARVYELPFAQANALTSLVPAEASSISEALDMSGKFKKQVKADGTISEIIRIAKGVEGLIRHTSVHAAGIVIADKPVSRYIPLFSTKKEKKIATQIEFRDLESLGLLKMDLLGLKAITLIDHTIANIKDDLGETVDIYSLPLDDKAVYDLLSTGHTTGIFQLESSGMQGLLAKAKPDKFTDIIAVIALYRPGPLNQGTTDDFIKGKQGRFEAEYDFPELEDILAETYGIILYQEQVMKISNVIGGFSLGQADILRKAMGKKDKNLMAQMKPKFIGNAVAKGFDEKKVVDLFAKMEHFAEYGFNKSHSTAYALMTYRTAYLKAHYPAHFFAALMSLDSNNKDKMLKYMRDCKYFNIPVIPPDINRSTRDFAVDTGRIIFGLKAITHVGGKAIAAIMRARKELKRFSDLFQFCEHVDLQKVNKKVIEYLIMSGSFDSMGYARSQLLEILESTMEYANQAQKEKQTGQKSLFGMAPRTKPKQLKIKKQADSLDTRLKYEYEALSFFVSGHPINPFRAILRHFGIRRIDTLFENGNSGNGTCYIAGVANMLQKKKSKKSKKEFAYLVLEDLSGACEVMIFPTLFEQTQDLLQSITPLVIKASRDTNMDKQQMIAEEIIPLDQFINTRIRSLDLQLPYDRISPDWLAGLEKLLAGFPGACHLRLVVAKDDRHVVIRPHTSYGVHYHPDLVNKLEQFLGKDKIQLLLK